MAAAAPFNARLPQPRRLRSRPLRCYPGSLRKPSIGPGQDHDGNTYDFNYTGRPNNDGSYSDHQVDQLLDEQRQTSDEARRKDALRKAEQIYVVDDPARVWFRFRVTQLLTSKKLQGLEPYPDSIPRLQFASLAR